MSSEQNSSKTTSKGRIRIDVHNHVYTKSHLDAIKEFGPQSGWTIRQNPRTGTDMLYGEREYPFNLTRSCYDFEQRIKELDGTRPTGSVARDRRPCKLCKFPRFQRRRKYAYSDFRYLELLTLDFE